MPPSPSDNSCSSWQLAPSDNKRKHATGRSTGLEINRARLFSIHCRLWDWVLRPGNWKMMSCGSSSSAPLGRTALTLIPKLSEQQKSCTILQSSSLCPLHYLLQSVLHTFSSGLHAERDDHHLAGPRRSSTSSGSSHWDRALCQNPAGLSLRRRLEKGFATGQVTNKFQFPSIS